MEIHIDEQIVASANKCNKDYGCLNNRLEVMCKVTRSVNDYLLFIDCTNKGYCYYKMHFGNFYVCNCPVRKEIYKKYKL